MRKLELKDEVKYRDLLFIIGKSKGDTQAVYVDDVLSVDGKEEIIIDSEFNKYFITDMYLDGDSWAKEIYIVKDI